MLLDLSADDERKVVELLAHIYNVIPWAKMRTSKNPHDVFNHRIRAASRRATLYEAVSKLANYFGLQSLPPAAAELVRELRPVERQVLDKLYREHIMMSMLGIMLAKQWRGQRKKLVDAADGERKPKRVETNETKGQAARDVQGALDFEEVPGDVEGSGG